MKHDAFEAAYPELSDFLVCCMSDPPDAFTEEQLVREFTSESPRVAVERVLEEFYRLLACETIPSEAIRDLANRYLTSEAEARAWVQQIVGLIEADLPKRD